MALVVMLAGMGRITVVHAADAAPQPAEQLLYLPVVYNHPGGGAPDITFDLAYVTAAGAWLSTFDGAHVTQLTTDVQAIAHDDQPVIRVAPNGEHLALLQPAGWALYRRNSSLVAAGIGAGFALDWDVATGRDALSTVLLSQKGHGIDRWNIATQTATPFVVTSDDTKDHSPLWNSAFDQLAFAHHEFGTLLYVTLIDPFDLTLLPYTGENRAANKFNVHFQVLEAIDSWHDQPIVFHWSTDEQALIFAAKATIYVVDMQTKAAVTITPPGFGEKESGRAVDVVNDQILYVAQDGIYVVALDGQGAQRVVAGTDLHFPRWTPNGAQIAYRGRDDTLHLVNADGSNDQIVPNTAGIQQFVLLP